MWRHLWSRVGIWLRLTFILANALLAAICGFIAWLIVEHRHGWSRGDKIGVVAIAVAVGAAFAAVIGPPLFERWLDRRSAATETGRIDDPVPAARKAGVLDERPQDRRAVIERLRAVRDQIRPRK